MLYPLTDRGGMESEERRDKHKHVTYYWIINRDTGRRTIESVMAPVRHPLDYSDSTYGFPH